MKALAELKKDLESELKQHQQMRPQSPGIVWIVNRLKNQIGALEDVLGVAHETRPAEQLRLALSLLESAAAKLDLVRSAGLTNIAATYVRSMLEVLDAEAKLDAKLDQANQIPAQSAGQQPAEPPRGGAAGSSHEARKAGGQ